MASCEQLRALALRPIECPEGVWVIRTAAQSQPVGTRGHVVLRLTDGSAVQIPTVTGGRDLGLDLDDNVTGFVLPLGTIAEQDQVVVTDYLGVLAPTSRAERAFRASVIARAPGAGFLDFYSLGGELRFLPLLRYLIALLTVGVALTVVAFLVAGVDLGTERGRALAPLRQLGTPLRVLRRSQAIVIAAPGLLGVVLAITMGLLAAQGFVAIRGTDLREVPTAAVLAAVGILFTLAPSAGGVVGVGRSKGEGITLRE